MKILSIIIILFCGPRLLADGIVSSAAGVNGKSGYKDGTGAGATFNDPMGLARDSQGNVFVCDARNHVIRKISRAGVVTTLAGMPGVPGAVNGVGSTARFRFPADIAISTVGDLYIADSGNHCIRRIQPDGTVTTLAGNLGSADDIDSDHADYALVARSLDGLGTAARFNNPCGIAFDPGGQIYVSDTGNQTIRRVGLDGSVVTVAGKAGDWGTADGVGADARFQSPMGLCVAQDGNLYIADSENHTIRRMTPQGSVTTFSGSPSDAGCKSGPRLQARYCSPIDITPHPEGGFIICESFGNALFRMDADGLVSLMAGGDPQANKLSNPSAAVCDDLGNVFVSDTFNQEIRLIIEKFGMKISKMGAEKQLTLTWDSLPGRNYQLQCLGDAGWENAPQIPVQASSEITQISFPLPQKPNGIYRILLLGF